MLLNKLENSNIRCFNRRNLSEFVVHLWQNFRKFAVNMAVSQYWNPRNAIEPNKE